MYEQVKKLFDLVKHKGSKLDARADAWDLRQLYTFAFRRQRDSSKRGQVPRDYGWVVGWKKKIEL